MEGIHTALVTPFLEDGSVDLETYETLCIRQIGAGINGLVPCGTTGETPTLTHEEWAECVSVAVQASKGRVPVTAGVGTNATRTTIANIEAAAALGVDAGLMVFPYYNKPNPEGLRQHTKAALDVGLPLVLYHVPGRTGQRLNASLLAELANLDGVVAVKEATGDLGFGGDVLKQTPCPILSGDDFTFLALLALGGRGCISVVSNVFPEHTLEIYDHFIHSRQQAAQQAMMKLLPVVEFLFSVSNPVPCKAAMEALNLCNRRVRLPLAPYSGDHAKQVVQAFLG
jgi:4-hydroxy-tetrahydrodipicolinate synthase